MVIVPQNIKSRGCFKLKHKNEINLENYTYLEFKLTQFCLNKNGKVYFPQICEQLTSGPYLGKGSLDDFMFFIPHFLIKVHVLLMQPTVPV